MRSRVARLHSDVPRAQRVLDERGAIRRVAAAADAHLLAVAHASTCLVCSAASTSAIEAHATRARVALIVPVTQPFFCIGYEAAAHAIKTR